MTAARRPGFDPDVWNGDKPIVEPHQATISVGDLVALREPVDADGDPIIRGVVLAVEPDRETGELIMQIAREYIAKPTGQYTEIRWEFRWEHHPASLVDPAWHVPSSVFNRTKSSAAAGRICLAVGKRYLNGADWSREDRLLIGGALVLADLEARGRAS